MTEIRYLLDSNIFIEASRKYYHFEICPDFWSALIEQHHAGRVFSIDRVKQELTTGSLNDEGSERDNLSLWVKDAAPKSLFASCNDLLVIQSYKEIIQAVNDNPQYYPSAKEEFAGVADSWLIAYAKAHNMVVVTHENNSSTARKRVLMPVVCKEFDIPVVTLFEMLLNLKIQFVRKPIVAGKKGK